MYLDYFSLERHPFRITPDTSLFFSGGDQGRGVVLDAMLFAIQSGEGILKVVGEVGSGKTMLCRMLEERLPDTTEIVYLANPRLSPDEILYAVAFELKLPVRRDTSKLLVMQQLQTYLIKQHAANRKVLVIIEEAQGMPVETLEEIRLFSNLETQVDKLMQIILFGQPELDKNLRSKNIRQLRERITHSFHLNPLTRDEVSAYVRFRLGAAGCPCPQLLTKRAEWLLHKASGGLTRRINILVDKALLSAYAENVLGTEELDAGRSPVIGVRHIRAAIFDSDYISSSLHSQFSPLRIVSAGMVLAGLIMAIVLWPAAGSIADTAQVFEQMSGKFTQQPAPANAGSQSQSIAQETREPQPNSSDRPIEPGINAADIAAQESAESALDFLVSSTEAFATEEAPAAVTATQPDLLEGFVQPDWVSNIAAEPLLQDTIRTNTETPISVSNSFLQQRVLASVDWLRNAEGAGYTIQFLSGQTSDMRFAESFLKLLESYDLIAESYICVSSDGGSSYWTVKYGNFEGLSVAQNFIDRLPERIHDYKPFVQNMSNVECNSNNSIAALILE